MRAKLIYFTFSTLVTLSVAVNLSSYNIDATKLTLSGFSSGADFVVNFDVAYSSEFIGMGIFAGGPYYCNQGKKELLEGVCTNATPDVNLSIASVADNFKKGLIDDPANLKNHKIYLYSGLLDKNIAPSVVKVTSAFFQNYVTPTTNVVFKNDLQAGHGVPTNDKTYTKAAACAKTENPYINQCDYDGAGALLNHLLGPLTTAAAKAAGELIEFDQTPYASTAISLHKVGHLYVPTACKNSQTKCLLHVSLHGCAMVQEEVGDAYYAHAGFNTWAESNNIIVLYPQLKFLDKINPIACWDYNYTDTNFPVKSSIYMVAIKNMMNVLMGKATTPTTSPSSPSSSSSSSSSSSYSYLTVAFIIQLFVVLFLV